MPEPLVELARVAHEQKDYKGSLGYLAHARDLEPDSARLHYYFGLVCLDLDLMAEARNSLRRLSNSVTSDAPSYNVRDGRGFYFSAGSGGSRPFFEKYLKLRPEDPRGEVGNRCRSMASQELRCISSLAQTGGRCFGDPTAAHYYWVRDCPARAPFYEARDELERALKAQPDYTDALAQLGQYYLGLKDFKEAERQLSRALQFDPSHYSANFVPLDALQTNRDPRREAQEK